jgi:peroxiredoxin Q/BCP
MIKEGDSVPDFEVKNQKNQIVRSESIGDAVIYFYPKADTSGCTTEACNFRDNIGSLNKAGIEVYGISTDSIKEQKAFYDKYDLNFDLLADENGKVAEKFGVLQESGYAERTTFIVKNGEIEKVFRKVDPERHITEVIKYLEN